MVSITSFLVGLTIFLIPSNLAVHWPQADSYISGHLIDYLIPRLYLSDLPILLILILNWRKLKPALVFLPLYFYQILQTIIISPHSSTIWYVFKFVELSLFLIFIRSKYTPHQLLNLAISPLVAMSLIQFSVSLYQYINQSSIFGYIFLGEVDLGAYIGLAQSNLSGAQRVLAYGTTPHPNILAGYMLLVWLLFNLKSLNNPNQGVKYYPNILFTGLLIVTLIITESVTTLIIGLLMYILLYLRKSVFGSLIMGMLLMSILLSSLATLLPSALIDYHSNMLSDFKSLTVRYRLNQAALSMINQKPLFGYGLNRFPALLIESNQLTTAPFIQPVHQIILLSLVELGFAGICLFIICSHRYYRQQSSLTGEKRFLGSNLIIFSLVLIGLFDHYPVTLQTGQLLLILSLALL